MTAFNYETLQGESGEIESASVADAIEELRCRGLESTDVALKGPRYTVEPQWELDWTKVIRLLVWLAWRTLLFVTVIVILNALVCDKG